VYGDAPLPLLLPLRAGTINYVADAIGGRRGRPEHVLGRVVRDYRQGRLYETTERDLLCVNGGEHGFVLSFGTAVNYLRLYYAMEKQGAVQAAGLLTRLILSALAGTHLSRAVFQATQADVECDGEPVPVPAVHVLFAATLDRIAPASARPISEPQARLHARRRGARPRLPAHPAGAARLPRLPDRRAGRCSTTSPAGRPSALQAGALDARRDILPPSERLDVEVACRVHVDPGMNALHSDGFSLR